MDRGKVCRDEKDNYDVIQAAVFKERSLVGCQNRGFFFMGSQL